jgi:GNAT superfamily N-acetyltransferase
MISVGRASVQDVESICLIDEIIIGDKSRHDFIADAVSRGDCLVARMEGVPMAVAFVVLDRRFIIENFFISLLVVHPDFRRKGVATRLIEYAEKMCPSNKVFTSTNSSNSMMRKLLRSMQYLQTGVIENVDEGDPEIVYFKII